MFGYLEGGCLLWHLIRPDAVSVWELDDVKKRLGRYFNIMQDTRLARYLIAKKTPLVGEIDEDSTMEKLWFLHESARGKFESLLEKMDEFEGEGEAFKKLEELETPKVSFLDLKALIAERILESCHFCERRCKKNRREGEKGSCKVGWESYVSSAFLHYGEEAVLVPSGTIFFSGCTFKCVFCQNYSISQEWLTEEGKVIDGVKISPKQLASYARHLEKEGARNINYVGGDPTPNIHTIINSLRHLDSNITQLWNSNFYNSKEAMELLLDVIDFWLPDFKYGNDECAKKYSKVSMYFDVVSRNHKLAHDLGSGEMIIRHLVMPNHVECCTKPILEWVAENCPKALVNIMGQYRPEFIVARTKDYPEIKRRPSSKEMRKAQKTADDLGILWEPVS